ncbi:MAG: hypothetical protein ACEQSK_03525 [Sphingomonadaceae bacterium]
MNQVDSVLVHVLSALCVWRDVEHAPGVLADTAFFHILGTLGRKTLADAYRKDQSACRRYRLHERWAGDFGDCTWVEDHVFPIHQWKPLLLAAASRDGWQVDAADLAAIRKFVEEHYVVARIPERLHLQLSNRSMPPGWRNGPSVSIWDRYRDAKVTALMGRALVLPDSGDADSDFVWLG